MKITIEKVPQGVRLTVAGDRGTGPQTVVLTAAQVETLVSLLPSALRADVFKFEYQT